MGKQKERRDIRFYFSSAQYEVRLWIYTFTWLKRCKVFLREDTLVVLHIVSSFHRSFWLDLEMRLDKDTSAHFPLLKRGSPKDWFVSIHSPNCQTCGIKYKGNWRYYTYNHVLSFNFNAKNLNYCLRNFLLHVTCISTGIVYLLQWWEMWNKRWIFLAAKF